MLVTAGRRSHTRNLVAFGVEHSCLLDVVAVARAGLIAVQIRDGAGDQLALDVVPGAGADAVAGIDARRGAPLFLAKIGMPRAPGGSPANRLGWVWVWQIWSAPASPPRLPVPFEFSATKKLARSGFIWGACCCANASMTADPVRAMTTVERMMVLVIVIMTFLPFVGSMQFTERICLPARASISTRSRCPFRLCPPMPSPNP
jgi:hypothetical protein